MKLTLDDIAAIEGVLAFRYGEFGKPKEVLTLRQRECLVRVAKGEGVKQIADTLGISDGTVKVHFLAIKARLEAPNMVRAVVAALSKGIITLEEINHATERPAHMRRSVEDGIASKVQTSGQDRLR